LNFPTVVKNTKCPKNSEKLKKNLKIPTLVRKCVGKFWNKFPEIPEYSKKILKIIKKFPHLPERAENAENAGENTENAWEYFGINSQKFQNAPKKFQKISENSHAC